MNNILGYVHIIQELFTFLWKEKLWWMIPMLIVFLVFAFLLLTASASPFAPFMYTLF